jgi:hypothetical protein
MMYNDSKRQGVVKVANHMCLPDIAATHAKPDIGKAILCMGRTILNIA